MFVANIAQLFLDDRENALFFREDVAQIVDRLNQAFVLGLDLVALHPGELIKPELENLIGLVLTDGVAAVSRASRITKKDTDFFDLLLGKLKSEQLHPRFIPIG